MHVYKSKKLRKDGVRWGYNIFHKNKSTGKEKRVTKETFRTRKEAQTAMEIMAAKIKSGAYDPIHGERKEIVSDLFPDFTEHYAKSGVTQATVHVMEQGMQKHFIGWFGDYKIDIIKSADLDDFLSDLSLKLVNHRSYIYYVTQFFEFAKRKRIILENPMYGRSDLMDTVDDKGNKGIEKIPVHYTAKELDIVLNLMKEHLSCKQYTYFLLLSKTGLRKSEGLALHKDDIDLVNMRITINKTLTRDRNGQIIVAKGTKSRAKNTTAPEILPLAPELKEPLQTYLDTVGRYNKTKYYFYSHHPKSDGHLSMSAPDKWLRNFYTKHMEELITLGVNHKIKVHGFRHTFVSIMQAKNVNPNVIMYLTRHANLTTTYAYTHFDVNTIEDLMN